ncbi:Hypothetical predicted protein [Pelobates cultripes]|uniref:Uncharacterized protein n=1 Tax=Pelobates cultripes TaxID=61616 RepID=A0AAD1RFU3_PELCU|nr:Hypothetical predicted protein [Pelobates cultripes]
MQDNHILLKFGEWGTQVQAWSSHIHPAEVPTTSNSNVCANIMEAPARGSNYGLVRARETSGMSHIGFNNLSGGLSSTVAYMKQSTRASTLNGYPSVQVENDIDKHSP